MAGMKHHDHVREFIPSEENKSESTEDQETQSEVYVRKSGQIHRICQMTSSNEGMSRTGARLFTRLICMFYYLACATGATPFSFFILGLDGSSSAYIDPHCWGRCIFSR